MATAARLERLCKTIQQDLDALPDRDIKPAISDDEISGGVSLEPAVDAGIEQPTAAIRQPPLQPIVEEANTERRLQESESSYNPSTITKRTILPPKPSAPLAVTNLQRGDLAPAQQHFTPILALAKYPYKYCNKAHSQDIASAFFDQGKFWARDWDL